MAFTSGLSVMPYTTRRTVAAGAFLKARQTKAKAPSKSKGKVVSNQDGSVNAQQFQLRLGKNTTIPITLGFTKSNELFVGRMAMIGFASAVLGEIVTGKGALAQLSIETGVPVTDIDGIVLAIIVFNFFAALVPAKGKLVLPEEELAVGPKGALQDPSVSLLQPKKFFGFSGFGFTKENELFVGRLAQLGFAAALLGEAMTGVGPLKQLGLETGIPLNEAEPLLLASIVFTLFAAVNEGRGQFTEE